LKPPMTLLRHYMYPIPVPTILAALALQLAASACIGDDCTQRDDVCENASAMQGDQLLQMESTFMRPHGDAAAGKVNSKNAGFAALASKVDPELSAEESDESVEAATDKTVARKKGAPKVSTLVDLVDTAKPKTLAKMAAKLSKMAEQTTPPRRNLPLVQSQAQVRASTSPPPSHKSLSKMIFKGTVGKIGSKAAPKAAAENEEEEEEEEEEEGKEKEEEEEDDEKAHKASKKAKKIEDVEEDEEEETTHKAKKKKTPTLVTKAAAKKKSLADKVGAKGTKFAKKVTQVHKASKKGKKTEDAEEEEDEEEEAAPRKHAQPKIGKQKFRQFVDTKKVKTKATKGKVKSKASPEKKESPRKEKKLMKLHGKHGGKKSAKQLRELAIRRKEAAEERDRRSKTGTLFNPVIGNVVFLMSAPAGIVLVSFGAFLWFKSQDDVEMGA